MRLGVATEVAQGERRVALVPEVVGKLTAQKDESDSPLWQVAVQAGAGLGAGFSDQDYIDAGAEITQGPPEDSDLLVSVGWPDTEHLRSGQVVVGLLQPLLHTEQVEDLAGKGVTVVSLDGLPRTLSRAQGMDALSSQANVAGYKAVLVATEYFTRYLPMLITAAGTSKPAEVLVLGAGVAGLQAIGTAKRLGAIVRAYDVRSAAKNEVVSVGGQFIELKSVETGGGEGGYARALTPEEQAAQQAELEGHIARHDIVITTAQVPGRRPPLLVTESALTKMKRGSVLVDMGASDLGGNVEGSKPAEVVTTPGGVTIVGAGHLASLMATSASAAYARNASALVTHLCPEGSFVFDPEDEIAAGVVFTHDGKVVHPGLKPAEQPASADQPTPTDQPAPTDEAAPADQPDAGSTPEVQTSAAGEAQAEQAATETKDGD